MAKEIERKFMVVGESWRDGVTASYMIQQGYVTAERERSVRIRIRTLLTEDGKAEPEAFLTMKFGAAAIVCDEFEYTVPYDDAVALMSHADGMTISKVRHIVPFEGREWEVDEYQDKHTGLVIAEIEGEDVESLNKVPEWVGKELTTDPYYKNANLCRASKTL
jgi:adenylate cyclase